jgi:GAF domain-containing protein/HAMP domain-containing protein
MDMMTKLPQKSSARAVDSLSVQARRAFGVGIVTIIISLLVLIPMAYLAIRYDYVQMYYVVGTLSAVIVLSIIAIVLSRRGLSTLSGWLIITGIFIAVVVLSLLITNIGESVSLFGLFAILYVATQVLPQRQVRWATFLGLLALIVARLAQSYPIFLTVSTAVLEGAIQTGVIVALFIIGILIIREFTSLSLTNKLLVTFLVTAVIVTYAANYFNQSRTSATLTNSAGQSLHSLAANQSQAIGDVMASEINSLISLSLGSSMQNWIKAANEAYPNTPGDVQKILTDYDRQWRAAITANDMNDPLVHDKLTNEVAAELNQFAAIFPNNHDLLVSDVQGGLLASTYLVPNYYQAIQFWWITTFNQGQGDVYYVTSPFYDTNLKQNIVIISIPVVDRSTGKILGILRTSYVTTGIEEIVNSIRVGETGKANIYFPSGPTQYIKDGQLLMANTNFLEDLATLKELPFGELVSDNTSKYVSQAMIKPATPNKVVEDLGWWLVVQQEKAELLKPVVQQTQQAGFLSSIIIGIVSGLAILLSQFLAGPIVRLTKTAEQVRGGDLTARATIEADDEVGNLALSFNSMTYQLRQMLQGLEQRVGERTRELSLAGDVGRSLSQERDLPSLLKTAVDMIQESFDLYYTQIYLADPAGHVLLLKSGYGEVGDELIRRAHRLPIGAGSINGQAAEDKKPMIVADTALSPTFKANPLLPNTRSEMAVPLLVGPKLVGVLDMQSEKPGTFSTESLPAYEALAGQLAVAVENAALFEQAQAAETEMASQARRLTREGWLGFLDAIERKERFIYGYEDNNVVPVEATSTETPLQNPLKIPIQVIGEQVGSIQFEKQAEQEWTEDEKTLVNAVATQVARQIDSLRLLAQAEQYRREAELAARQLTREGWADFVKGLDEPKIGYVYDQQQVMPSIEEHSGNGVSEIIQPIEIRGEKLGEVTLEGVDNTDEKSLEMISVITERLAEHIEGIRLSAQTRSALMDTEALYSIIASINSANSYEDILKTLVGGTLFSQADQLTIMGIFDKPLSDTQIPEWIFPVAHKSTEKIEIAQRYPFNAFEATPHTLFTDQPAILNNLSSDHRLDSVTRTLFKEVFNSQSSIIVPLVLGNQIIGFVQGYFSKLTEFPDREIHRLVAVAGQVAIAVQSLILLEQAQARARQEQRIREVTAQVFSAVDVDAILQKAAEQVGRALGAPAYIYLGQNRSPQEVS